MSSIKGITCLIANPALRAVCERLDQGPHSPFGMWPASLSRHHAYPGGLLVHTLEVCEIAISLLETTATKVVNRDVVLAACLWHDYAKTKEYILTNQRGDERNLEAFAGMVWTKAPDVEDGSHPHIQKSADAFVRAMHRANTKNEIVEHIESCILSHHGRVEWGSPFEPRSNEAVLVHQADMISAQIGAGKSMKP